MRLVLMLFVLTTASAGAAVIGASTAAQSITEERIGRLPPAQQNAWREYMARSVRQMQADQAELEQEIKAAGMTGALGAPGGSAARSMPLDKPPEWYAGEEARRIAGIVVSFQTPAGGWSKNLNMADHPRRKGESFAANNVSAHLAPGDFDTPHELTWNYVGTLDNDATTTELRFLAKVASSVKNAEPYRASILRGLEYIFAAQFPNGGWPQVWPLEGGYHDAITFNDGAIPLTMELLQDVAEGKGDFGFVPKTVRTRAAARLRKGIECILATQIVEKGRRTVWAQQHDALTLAPAGARNYEPAAPCSSESAALVLFLMRLPKPSRAVVGAVYAAVEWFRQHAIYGKSYERRPDGRRLLDAAGAGPIWARFYEPGTGRPIFGDRDKSIHDDVNEISAERRNGYSWYNAAPKEALDRFREWSARHKN